MHEMNDPQSPTSVRRRLLELRGNLDRYFDKSELRSLCFELEIDYERLPDTKEDAVRELILYVIRHGQLELLIERCHELRPKVTWPEIDVDEATTFLQPPAEALKLTKREREERRQQLVLLNKVKNFWVKGVLEKSLADADLIEISQQPYYEAIDHPWHEVVGTSVYDVLSVSTCESILVTFRESDRALLILGEPGTGKTTTLLRLARELVYVAEQDVTQPIPVVLNLSSWAEEQLALMDWAVAELITKYQIPHTMSRPWLEDDKLVLLLDGLDEVPGRQRAECVTAINQFRADHGLTGIVVCSRSHEYETTDIRLKMGGAIVLQTLTPDQVDSYLAAAGTRLSRLRMAIQDDVTLRKMAQSPLMLNVMRLAYSDRDDQLAPGVAGTRRRAGDDAASIRQHLFAAYVLRMFRRHGVDPNYPESQTKRWLTWLAQGMTDHNQTVFLIEQMQPSWLATQVWRWCYLLMSRLVGGLFIGIFAWLFIMVGLQLLEEDNAFYQQVADTLGVSLASSTLLIQIVLYLGLGFVVAVIDWLHFEKRFRREGTTSIDRVRGIRQLVVVGLSVWLLAGAAYAFLLSYHPLRAFYSGLFAAMAFAAVFGYIDHGQSYRTEIRTVEALSWSWKRAIRVDIPSLLPALIAAVAIGVLYEPSTGLLVLLAIWLGGFLINGLRHHRLEIKSWPNQGIWLSARNSILAALLFGLVFGVVALVIVLWSAELPFSFALLVGSAIGIAAGQLYGAIDVIKHLSVRSLLQINGHMTWNYANFLDHCAKLVLLYKVGSGYIFVHRFFQSYFANLGYQEYRRGAP